MSISRRKFLRLAPASVGAVVLGAATLPKVALAKRAAPSFVGLSHLEGEPVHVFPAGITYLDKAFIRAYEKGARDWFVRRN